MKIEGEFWTCEISEWEYKEWNKYADSHKYLLTTNYWGAYWGVLEMFLNHLRRGINLNTKSHRDEISIVLEYDRARKPQINT